MFKFIVGTIIALILAVVGYKNKDLLGRWGKRVGVKVASKRDALINDYYVGKSQYAIAKNEAIFNSSIEELEELLNGATSTK